MSNKEIQEFNEKLRRGLELAEIIRRIPAKQVIADNPIFQD